MADSNIGALPQAEQLEDDSLLVAEQQGQAVKVTGAQFKEFGRQAVVGQVQGYVDQAQAAANQAVSAVSAVTEMTVEAQASQEASVTKSTRAGKVHLTFGLPRGERGVPGPEGPVGAQGPRGETGKGLDILGYYDTQTALEAAVTAPEPGDAYGVGTEAPFDIFVFDGVSGTWKNNGPLSGGGGIVPENVVTSEGGAALEIPDSFGGAPHVITFDEEEDVPLTAEDIAYGDDSVAEALENLFTCVSDGKALIASAITDKGVPTQPDAAFSELAEHVGQLSGGADTADATAASFDILAPKTAYTAHGKVEGVIPSLGARTYTPGVQAQTIANGQYLSGVQTIQGDSNLTSGNIKKGVSIFGVEGAVEQSFLATLTVTADVGAVVTAAHTGGTEVEALSTTGTVTLELPLEGEWTVTARRGVAQYNSVVVNVSSQYSAALTAEVHIIRYGDIEAMGTGRAYFAGTEIGGYALFGGGQICDQVSGVESDTDTVESYDKYLVRKTETPLNYMRSGLAALSIGAHALFAGGFRARSNGTYADVDQYDSNLVHTAAPSLSSARQGCGAAVVGDYGLFAGGRNNSTSLAAVDTYTKELTRGSAEQLLTPSSPIGTANDDYALFYGDGRVTAYDKSLTRAVAANLSFIPDEAARSGSYIIFCGQDSCEAYDLFLTRVAVEPVTPQRAVGSGVTLCNCAIFAGGSSLADSNPVHHTDADVYDSFLVHTTTEKLSSARYHIVTASVEDFAIFAGGYMYYRNGGGSYYSKVDVYQYV